MVKPRIIAAIGTPLDDSDGLHQDGLRRHLDEQTAAKMDGILVAGTMGLMQLLSDKTYLDLAKACASYWKDSGEVLVGVGDASYARTLDRLNIVNTLQIDGVVVLSPYFFTFSQPELIDYYQSLASASRTPLFLYDLPQRTRTSLEIKTVLALAEHPNIAGIKCSGDVDQTKRLITALEGSTFRVIVAQPTIVDSLIREGIGEHLDGVFSITPQLVRQIADAAGRGDWETARQQTAVMERLLISMQEYGVFPAMTAILNAHGIEGRFGPRPFHMLSEHGRRRLLAESSVINAFQGGLVRTTTT